MDVGGGDGYFGEKLGGAELVVRVVIIEGNCTLVSVEDVPVCVIARSSQKQLKVSEHEQRTRDPILHHSDR